MCCRRFKTGAVPDDAVHVLNPAALYADHMMMIIADPCLIERRGVCRFDAPYQSHFQQGVKVIIDGLTGEGTEAFAGGGGDIIGVEVPAAVNRREDGETGRGDPHSRRPQFILEHFRVD